MKSMVVAFFARPGHSCNEVQSRQPAARKRLRVRAGDPGHQAPVADRQVCVAARAALGASARPRTQDVGYCHTGFKPQISRPSGRSATHACEPCL